jgi:hypothetical protein
MPNKKNVTKKDALRFMFAILCIIVAVVIVSTSYMLYFNKPTLTSIQSWRTRSLLDDEWIYYYFYEDGTGSTYFQDETLWEEFTWAYNYDEMWENVITMDFEFVSAQYKFFIFEDYPGHHVAIFDDIALDDYSDSLILEQLRD